MRFSVDYIKKGDFMIIYYKGNKFILFNSNSIVDLESISEEVWIPEYYKGTYITAIDFDDGKRVQRYSKITYFF